MATRVIPIKPLTSWSFSRYNDYKTCPARFKFKHLMRLKEPENEAMARGTRIHKLAEDYVKGVLKRMPVELNNFKEEFTDLRGMYKKNRASMIVEDQWGFNSQWQPAPWDDWTGCWLRVKLDLAFTLQDVLDIVDHKTGRNSAYKNAEYLEQCELYACTGLMRFPAVQKARPRLWYLDEGTLYPEDNDTLVFTQKDLPRLTKLWQARVKPMFNDKTFKPKPSESACRFCHYKKANGGPCVY